MNLSSFPDFNWSALPPVPLLGLGTSDVESAFSYLVRLSDVIGRPPWRFSKSTRGVGRVRGQRTPNWVHLLVELSGNQDLLCGTFWRLERVARIRLEKLRDRRWCPMCYAEAEDDFYEPLAWCMHTVTTCSRHGCSLVEQCARCGCKQSEYSALSIRKICRGCSASLGGTAKPRRIGDREQWVITESLKLLKFCAKPGAPQVDPVSFFHHLSTLRNLVASVGRSDIWRGQADYMTKGRLGHHAPIPVTDLLQVAAMAGVSVIEILEAASFGAVSGDMFMEESRVAADGIRNAVLKHKLTHLIQSIGVLLCVDAGIPVPRLEHLVGVDYWLIRELRRSDALLVAEYEARRSGISQQYWFDRALVTAIPGLRSWIAGREEMLGSSSDREYIMHLFGDAYGLDMQVAIPGVLELCRAWIRHASR